MASSRFETHTIAGCGVRVLRGGRGTPLLFLHGAAGGGMWLPFMDKLAERFEVIVPDHPGYGQSDRPEWLDELSDLAYFYLDFMKALDLDRVHLVGHSLGGWLAAEIAIRSTARLASLTLVSAAGLHINGVSKGDLFLWSPEERVRNLFVDQSFADARLAQPMTDEAIDIALKNELATADLAWNPRFFHPQVRKWIHRIDVPTQIIWGDGDKIFPPRYAEEYNRLIRGSKLSVLSCGHIPQVEKAGAFVDLLTRFVEDVR